MRDVIPAGTALEIQACSPFKETISGAKRSSPNTNGKKRKHRRKRGRTRLPWADSCSREFIRASLIPFSRHLLLSHPERSVSVGRATTAPRSGPPSRQEVESCSYARQDGEIPARSAPAA